MTTRRQYTPDDLLKLTIRPMPELVDGRFVKRPMLGMRSDSIATTLGYHLMLYSRSTLPGLVNGGRCGFQIFPDDPDKVRVANVAFTKIDRLTGGKPAIGHARVRPDLVAEVVSPRTRVEWLRERIRDYLNAEIPLILIVYPSTREVEMILGNGSHTFLKEGDTIDGGDILPGFSCHVSTLFDGI